MTDSIWQTPFDAETFTRLSASTANAAMGIELVEIGADFLRARMPVDARTRQPAGILHGGASVLLAETLASWAGFYTLGTPGRSVVGQEINANHIRPVREGWVIGTTRPVHLGRRSQVWETRIETEDGKLVCISRMTLAVIDLPVPGAGQRGQ